MSLVEIFNGAVILILMRWYFVVEWKVWKKDDVKSFRRSSVSIKFSVEVGKIPAAAKKFLGSSSCRPNVSKPLLISGISDLVTVKFRQKVMKELIDQLLLMKWRWS